MRAVLHGARESLWAGPQHRGEAAFVGEELDRATACHVGEKPERAVEAGLAAAVGSGDDRQRAEFQPEVAERAVAGDAEGGNGRHGGVEHQPGAGDQRDRRACLHANEERIAERVGRVNGRDRSTCQGLQHDFRLAIQDPQEGPDRRVEGDTGLFPIAYCRHGDGNRAGKLFLRYSELHADRSHVWCRPEGRQWRVRILIILDLVTANVCFRRGRDPVAVQRRTALLDLAQVQRLARHIAREDQGREIETEASFLPVQFPPSPDPVEAHLNKLR